LKIYTVFTILFTLIPTWSKEFNPKAGKLTHLFYTPTTQVNPKNHLVAGLNEFSYGLGSDLQVQLSLLGSIGHIDFGVKYQLGSDMAVGAGISDWLGAGHHAGSFYHGSGHHHGNRFGMFLTGALLQSSGFSSAYTLHSQIGSNISVGLDIGGINKFESMWSIILEAGSSLNIIDLVLNLSGIGGIRIVPPSIPFLFIDFGISPLSLTMGKVNNLGGPSGYIDISVAFDLN